MSDFKITKNENQKDPVDSHMLFTKALHRVFSCFIAAGYMLTVTWLNIIVISIHGKHLMLLPTYST